MVRLQPSLPKRREEEEGADKKQREGQKTQKPKTKPMQDKRLLAGIVIVIAALILVLFVLWVYPPKPPGPENTLSDSQVRAELQRLAGINANPASINPNDYPKVIGLYGTDKRVLEERYFCSDVCPAYGRVDLVYRGVDSEECARIGGKVLHDLAFGAYIGCEPRV